MAKCPTCTGEVSTPRKTWKMAGRPDRRGKRTELTIGLFDCPRCNKAFRKVLNNSDIDDDTREALMGHKLPGSRGSYFDSHDADEIAKKYARCDFSRPGTILLEDAKKEMLWKRLYWLPQ